MRHDPFAALGLAADPDLTDDEVRVAWRRVAAATHPDRGDGGDPAAFAMAANAYSDLRTRFGRNEALADLAARTGRERRRARWAGRMRPGQPGRVQPRSMWPGRWAGRMRPGRLALRVVAAAGVSVLVLVIAGWQPATPALMVGALTWLVRSARHDLNPTQQPGTVETGPRIAQSDFRDHEARDYG